MLNVRTWLRNWTVAVSAAIVCLTTQTSVFGQTSTWDGGGTDDFWLTPANWNLDQLPLPNSILSFAGTARLTPNNNNANGTSISGINFASGAGSFNLQGNGITLGTYKTATGGFLATGTGSISNSSTNAQTLSLPITISAGSHAIFATAGSGAINLTGALSRSAGGYVLFGQVGATPGAINLTGTGLSNTNGILGGWAGYTTQAINLTAGNTLNPTGFAALDANGNVVIAPNSVYTDALAGVAIAGPMPRAICD